MLELGIMLIGLWLFGPFLAMLVVLPYYFVKNVIEHLFY